jgi:hypothetical protein
MTANGTSLTSRDVRLESAKRANADIDQIAVARVYESAFGQTGHRADIACPLRAYSGHGRPKPSRLAAEELKFYATLENGSMVETVFGGGRRLGTHEKCRDVRYPAANWGKADSICSQ